MMKVSAEMCSFHVDAHNLFDDCVYLILLGNESFFLLIFLIYLLLIVDLEFLWDSKIVFSMALAFSSNCYGLSRIYT